MQNRYVVNIGDYVKLGIIRALSSRHRLGAAWWLFPDEAHNKDARHIGYLQKPEQWRHFVEIEHWADRLQAEGFATVDAIRGRPYSPVLSSCQTHLLTFGIARSKLRFSGMG